MTTKMREEFEKWWCGGRCQHIAESDEDRIAWKAWQASARVEREACAKAAKEVKDDFFVCDREWEVANTIEQSVRARGEE